MRLNYKKIKTVLLLSALSCCWQSSPLAMDEPQGSEGGYERKREEVLESTVFLKKTNQYSELLSEEKEFFYFFQKT